MKGVILAAGDGTRLVPLTLNCPKPLSPVLGRPLLDYTIGAFVEAGLRELVLVIGYKGEMIRHYVGDGSRYGAGVEYAFNPDYQLGNALSVYAAQEVVGDEPFLLAMADHMISPHILKALLATQDGHDTLCVDRQAHAPPQVNDATRVWVVTSHHATLSPEHGFARKGVTACQVTSHHTTLCPERGFTRKGVTACQDEAGFIARIGKGIEPWNAIDTGVFLFTPRIFAAISHLPRAGDEGCGISDAITWLIEKGHRMRACDVSGAFWMDVDTLGDLRYVEQIMRTKEGKRWIR